MVYDMFGRSQNSVDHRSPVEPVPYQVDKREDGTIYLRFYATTPCAVQRITADGAISTVMVAYGDWDDRDTLTYQQVNQLLEA